MATTRPASRMAEAEEIARDMGLGIVVAESLRVVPSDAGEFEPLTHDESDEWPRVVITSPTVIEVCDRVMGQGRLSRFLRGRRTVAIGPRTAIALREAGVEGVEVSDVHTSAGLIQTLSVDGTDTLVLRSTKGSEDLVNALRAAGIRTLVMRLYDLEPICDSEEMKAIWSSADCNQVDAFAITSPLSAKGLMEAGTRLLGRQRAMDVLSNALVGAIGPPTRNALEHMGVRVDVMPERATFPSLLLVMRERQRTQRP